MARGGDQFSDETPTTVGGTPARGGWLGVAWKVAPATAALMLAAAQHWSGKAETDKKLDVGYKTTEQVIAVLAAELDDQKRVSAQLADSVQVLQRLALSGQPGFNTTGAPVKVAAVVVGQRKRTHVVVPPADPTLVKKLQENQLKNSKLQAHLEAKAPPSPTVPPALPAEPPPAPPQPSVLPVDSTHVGALPTSVSKPKPGGEGGSP